MLNSYNLKFVFLSLKINFGLAYSADPDEMPHYAAFHLGLQFLQKKTFRGFQYTKVLSTFQTSGRVLDSRPKGCEFEPHRRHCVVSLIKNINPSLVLV